MEDRTCHKYRNTRQVGIQRTAADKIKKKIAVYIVRSRAKIKRRKMAKWNSKLEPTR